MSRFKTASALLIIAVSIEAGVVWGVWQGVVAFVVLAALRAAIVPERRCANCKFYREEAGKMVCFRFIEPIVGGYHQPKPTGFCSFGKDRND